MLHKYGQTDIFCEKFIFTITFHTFGIHFHLWRIDLAQEFALIRLTRLGNIKPGPREPILHNVLGVLNRHLETGLQICKLFLLVVFGVFPVHNLLTFPHGDEEKGIQKKDYIVTHGVDIEKHRLSLVTVHSVHHKGRLDHDEWIWDVFTVQWHAVMFAFIWTCAESL